MSTDNLNTPMWHFVGVFELWQYTLSEEFKAETPETQAEMLSRLDQLERIRPQDTDMKVRFG